MMELPFTSFSEAFGTKIAIGLLTVATAATSGIAGYKIVKTVSAQTPEAAQSVEVSQEQSDDAAETNTTARQVLPTKTPTPTQKTTIAPASVSAGIRVATPVITGRAIGDNDEDDDDKKEYEMEHTSVEEQSRVGEQSAEDHDEKPESAITPTPLP